MFLKSIMTKSSFFTVEAERREDSIPIEELLDMAFGGDRFAKSSYALRDGVVPVAALSLVLRRCGVLCGTIRFWPVKAGSRDDVLLLGPLGVHPDYQGHGGGQILMEAGITRARELGYGAVFLVGDLAYYRRAGFLRVPEGQVYMPGNPNPERLLFTELVPGALKGVKGMIEKY